MTTATERRQEMAGNGSRRGDSQLLAALAAGRTVEDAAHQANISQRTAFRRLADPEFQQQISQLRSRMIDEALGRLSDASAEAVETLRILLAAESENVRLGSARTILELGSRLRESVELEQRISRIEKALGNGPVDEPNIEN